ncbi:hypothetical protein SAMN05216419_100244 [Nitrosomonas cryotolerans]|uniref:Uncharacterized protein n=1 Tax=Nitrosomonas cryotolerans ATCC 49181 TaxID=1131553 RepID=A0A1N6GRW4_9PROT|nr:hypothetical protein [Nitrosomonas cryotolerans]SFP40179.1 hypothetical protein SAMN05216419_100244 [Nitrosomonas cryotolerans]SIO10290.1 hypothetical protein SAMN02743940_0837 [Nitrosomonas cryotolerans ATCC 49181]
MIWFILIITLINLTANVYAQLQRNFPTDSKLGRLTTYAFPEVRINDQSMYLSVGSQIRDKNNLIILPATLNETGFIRYQLDIMGHVHRIWFLTADETSQAKKEEK